MVEDLVARVHLLSDMVIFCRWGITFLLFLPFLLLHHRYHLPAMPPGQDSGMSVRYRWTYKFTPHGALARRRGRSPMGDSSACWWSLTCRHGGGGLPSRARGRWIFVRFAAPHADRLRWCPSASALTVRCGLPLLLKNLSQGESGFFHAAPPFQACHLPLCPGYFCRAGSPVGPWAPGFFGRRASRCVFVFALRRSVVQAVALLFSFDIPLQRFFSGAAPHHLPVQVSPVTFVLRDVIVDRPSSALSAGISAHPPHSRSDAPDDPPRFLLGCCCTRGTFSCSPTSRIIYIFLPSLLLFCTSFESFNIVLQFLSGQARLAVRARANSWRRRLVAHHSVPVPVLGGAVFIPQDGAPFLTSTAPGRRAYRQGGPAGRKKACRDRQKSAFFHGRYRWYSAVGTVCSSLRSFLRSPLQLLESFREDTTEVIPH